MLSKANIRNNFFDQRSPQHLDVCWFSLVWGASPPTPSHCLSTFKDPRPLGYFAGFFWNSSLTCLAVIPASWHILSLRVKYNYCQQIQVALSLLIRQSKNWILANLIVSSPLLSSISATFCGHFLGNWQFWKVSTEIYLSFSESLTATMGAKTTLSLTSTRIWTHVWQSFCYCFSFLNTSNYVYHIS